MYPTWRCCELQSALATSINSLCRLAGVGTQLEGVGQQTSSEWSDPEKQMILLWRVVSNLDLVGWEFLGLMAGTWLVVNRVTLVCWVWVGQVVR